MCEAFYMSDADWIGVLGKHDGNGLGCLTRWFDLC
jgi:hypothetical protein